MGIFDKLKGTASSVKKQADKALDQHGDKLVAGVDKAGGAVNKATKGKYADKVDKGVGLAKKPLSKSETVGPAGPGTGGTGPGVAPSEPVVRADPIDPADPVYPVDPVSTTGTADDPSDGGSRPSSPGTGSGSMPGTASPGSAP